MSGPRRIQAVSFDVGGTMIDPWPSVGHVYAAVAREQGLGDFDPDNLTRRFLEAWKGCENFDYTRDSWKRIVDCVFGQVRMPESFFPSLYDRFSEAEAWHLDAEAIPTLDALAGSGIRLAIISNWDERLRTLLERLDLARRFEILIISCETGCTKPSPGIFHAAAERLSIEPGSILHVGDSWTRDVLGARAAGFRALHFCPNDNREAPGRITRLAELLAHVKGDRSISASG